MKHFSIPLKHKHNHPLIDRTSISVPKELEVPILLIRNELQNRMLYNALAAIGVYESNFESHLDKLILASLRMWDGTDKTNTMYEKLIERHSSKVSGDFDVLTKRALKIYHSLLKARDATKSKSQVSNNSSKKIPK